MRQMIRSLALAAAVAMVSLTPLSPAPIFAQAAEVAPQPADARAAVPVKMVVLYSSGVGYFQHAGSVDGDATTELRFKSGQINDILKSLVLQDKGGNVAAVTYPSQDPLAKTLKSFQIDISSNPSLDQLLNQLRGAKVTLALPTEKIAGTILGVEKRTKSAGENKTYEVPVINIISGGSIRAVELPEVRDIQLEDPTLQDEMSKALTALASARDQDKKPVTIHFKGQGQRDVLLGYVVETPVWKTSYRLLLDQPAAPAAGADGKVPPASGAKLQGWAIVENQTDNDWKDVQLTLVSGRPISFVEDLYQPFYVPRPVVRPEMYASLNPQTYEGGMEQRAPQLEKAQQEMQQSFQRRAMAPMEAAAAKSDMAFDGPVDGKMVDRLDASRIQSIASAANMGELFQYTVGSVSLPRQTSAMIPIITDPIHLEKLSIFNGNVLAKHPLNGARIKNTTGKHLLAGPVTVIDASAYAGDAQINDVPPNQERLISYGIDLQMLVDEKRQDTSDELLTGKISKGWLVLSHKYIQTTTYEADNKSDHEKTLVIEHPITGGDWTLVDTQDPTEKTDALYRFQETIPAGKQVKLAVKEQSIQGQQFEMMQVDVDGLIAYSRNGPIPKSVKEALLKAAEMKRAVLDTQQKIDQGTTRENEISQDQKRINENLRNVDKTVPLYTTLLDKLTRQETELDKIQNDRKDFIHQKNDQQKQLEDYLATLNVE